MPVIESSKRSLTFEEAAPPRLRIMSVVLAGMLAAVVSACAVLVCWRAGWTLYYGDAEAHLNIARRIVDSRTPGYEQLGTAWLPMLHVLLLPVVGYDALWRSGLAGAIPPAACFVLGIAFFYAAVRRVFGSAAAGAVAAALYGLNPNALYLQSIPMTEAVFFAALAALLYFTVLFRERPSVVGLAGAGLAALAASLTRYEGWFLIPFTTAYFFWAARKHRRLAAILFGVIAALGPILWLAYNGLVFHNVWEFYSGPASAKAIQGGQPYPGYHDWKTAIIYFGGAVRVCAGAPLFFMAAAGLAAALWKRAFWPVILLALPGVFYLWSMHSAGTPIFLPDLWPHGYYNTRYGLVLLPLLAFSGGAIVAVAARLQPRSITKIVAWTAVASATLPWILNPHPDAWITWKESEVNSRARRVWTKKAADFLASHYQPGEGIFTSFGDSTGVFREAGIPLRATLTGDNGLTWQAAVLRPDLFLWEQWALVQGGDSVQTAINRARRRGPDYELVRQIVVENAPVIEIYQRSSAPRDLYHPPDDNSVPQSTRREE